MFVDSAYTLHGPTVLVALSRPFSLANAYELPSKLWILSTYLKSRLLRVLRFCGRM